MSTTHAGMTRDQRLDLAHAEVQDASYNSFENDAFNAEFDAGDEGSVEDLVALVVDTRSGYAQEGWPVSGDALAVRKATA